MNKVGPNISPIILEWQGPFGYRDNKLVHNQLDPAGPKNPGKVNEKKGIYCIIGDHHVYGARSLLYIGRTETTLRQRLSEHWEWLREEWRVEIYFTEITDIKLQKAAEKLLIYAHSPAYNSQHIDGTDFQEPFAIWNTGRYWGLLPEVCSEHPWYKQIKRRLKATKDR